MSDSTDLEEEEEEEEMVVVVVVVEKEEKTNPTTGKQYIVRNGWTAFMATVEISTPTWTLLKLARIETRNS
jgi:hypothetical protein